MLYGTGGIRKHLRSWLYAIAALAFFAMIGSLVTTTSAQITSTTLIGTVTDQSGAAMSGATVTVTNLDTSLATTAETNSDGEYRIEFLAVGKYKLEVKSKGFKGFVQSGITLAVGQTGRADAKLTVGDVSESVTVTSEIPTVNTSTQEINRTIESQEVTDLPLVNRNVYTLLTLVPGVQSSANSIVLGYPEQRTLINGGADGGAGSVSYYLDGGTNMTGLRNTGNILPNPDAIEEVRVETNNYNAEYGRFSGGVVNVVTKSGGNSWHGSLFEFYRDGAFNANNWGNLTGGTPPLHRNQFGGTVGGPIQKDKTFFFFSYQGLRQLTSTFLNNTTVPTTLERQGNFSQSAGVIVIDPVTNKQISCNGVLNVICPNRVDPVASKIMSTFIPPANVGASTWQGTIPDPFNSDDFLIKIDHVLTPNQRATLSYFETSGNNIVQAGTGNLPWSNQQFNWRQHVLNLSDTWTLSPTLVNQAWFNFTRNFGGRLNLPQTSLGDLGSAFTIQGTPSLPQITVTGYFTLSNAIAGPVAGTNFYSLRDVVSKTKGRHALSFGAEVGLEKDIQQTLLNNYGVFTFNATPYAKNGLANFLLGLPTTITQDSPDNAYDNYWEYGFFAQDDFRMFPRLTLNLGVRWDVQTPPTDPFDREGTFILGVQSTVVPAAPKGQLFVGDPGVTRGTVPVRYHHVSPRLGIAWDPFGDGKTAVRAGAGVFYGSVSGNEWNTTTNFEPYSIRFTLPNTGTAFAGGQPTGATLVNPYQCIAPTCTTLPSDPFPYVYTASSPRFIGGASIFGFAPNFQWPYSYQFNLAVQRQLTSGFSVQVAYVGTLTHDLPFATDLNYPVLTANATSSAASVIARRPIDNPNVGTTSSPFGQVLLVQSNQFASYHGLQVTATKRMGHHISVSGFYTFSKALDSLQLQNSTTQGGTENFSKPFLDKGRSDFDFRHQIVASAVWQLDYYNGGVKGLRWVLNGWEISPIVNLRSGQPFTVQNGVDSNVDGNSTDRAQLVPGMSPVLDPNRSRSAVVAQWFNTAAFTQNCVRSATTSTCTTFVDGNSARNLLDGPGFKNVDLAIFRNLRFRERFTLQARLDATNAFNMVSLNGPGATFGTANFGKITSAASMRQIQLGLKLVF